MVVGNENKKKPKEFSNKINKKRDNKGILKNLLSKFSFTWSCQCSTANSIMF